MTNLQPNANNANAAAQMPIVMGMKTNDGGKRIVCLGRLPKQFMVASGVIGQPQPVVAMRAEERKRFTVEALLKELKNRLGAGLQMVSDKRGIHANGLVRFTIRGEEIAVSTLPIEIGAGAWARTEYFVWEISMDGGTTLRAHAGRRLALERCLQVLRRAIVGY